MRYEAPSSSDDAHRLSVKLLANAASAILQARDQLNAKQLGRAVTLLSGARRVDCHGLGAAGVAAAQAQRKLTALGIPALLFTATQDALASAGLPDQGTVALFVCQGDCVEETAALVERAHRRSIDSILISNTPLAVPRPSRVVLLLDAPGDRHADGGTVIRILQLLAIDALAAGVGTLRAQALATLGERE